MQAALQVQDVSPELPTTFVTLHSDLLLRFFNIEQHIWVIPETITVSCSETITSMEWCPAPPEGELTLRWYLFLGTRSGIVLKVHLREILQNMLLVTRARGDVITTGIAAMETIRLKLKPYILQRQKLHEEFVTSLSLTPAGVLLSASLDGTVVLSRVSQMTVLRSFRVGNGAGVRFACITPLRNVIVTLSASNSLALWGNTHQSSHVELHDPISPHYFPIISVTVDDVMDQLITVDSSGYTKVWSLRTTLAKMSFHAVSHEVLSTVGHMYFSENGVQHNGHRLFDVDEKDKKRPRLLDVGGQHGAAAGGLQTALATVEAAMKAKLFAPARYVAYDGLSRRLFVSGAKNNVVCVFVSGLTSLKAHFSQICHLAVCEQHRSLLSTSVADCRLWSYNTGTLSLGLKANNPEFIMVRMAPVFSARSNITTSAQLVAFGAEPDRHTLDSCKKPPPTLSDVISAVYARAGAQRRERSANGPASAAKMRRNAAPPIRNRSTAGGVSSSSISGATNAGMAVAVAASAIATGGVGDAWSGKNVSGGYAGDDNLVKNQATSYRILCAHVDPQERYIFYALNNGDIRVHQSDSGRLSKTLVTTPPSTELILTAVVQYRHLFTAAKRHSEQARSTLSDDAEPSFGLTGSQMLVHEIAFILHRLLYHDDKLALHQEEQLSIHKEAVGMMTMHEVHELGVVYADGVIRFFPLLGNSVQAQRIIIPEFLVSRAISYMRLVRSLQRKLANISQEFLQLGDVAEAAEPQLNFIVEADAVSFVTVSSTLGFICLVQVNGRISIMDMQTPTGVVVQVFTVSGEVSAVAFLGAYPCLVVADTQGVISFFLVKGASMLNLLEDFYKSLVLHRRHQRSQQPYGVHHDNQNDDSYNSNSGYALRMWWLRIPGTPTVLHFDPVHGALYIGTRQGYFSSYLVRNLIVAFDLYPIIHHSCGKKSHGPHVVSAHRYHDSNEQRLFNVLLVFFGITPERVMRHINGERFARSAQWYGARPDTDNPAISASWQGTDSTQSLHVHCVTPPVARSEETISSGTSSAAIRSWKNSLSWIFEACKALFFPSTSFPSFQGAFEAVNLPFDIHTVTLSDLLIGTAILRHALLLMSMMATHFTVTGSPTRGVNNNTPAGDNPAAVSLTLSDIQHIRQCIVEEVRYRKVMGVTEHGQTDVAAAVGLPEDPYLEEEFDIGTVRDNSYVTPTAIASNWVELLFRRHVVHAAAESPLSLLSPKGILERARCERYERCKLLQLQCDLEQDAQDELAEGSWTLAPPAGQNTAITVDWDAFLEGNLTHLLEDDFRRRRGMTNMSEEEMLNTVNDGGGVRCITTRRNGVVFVGSANGSVAVWTPYGAARLQELCPSMLLEESLYHLGSRLKARLAQEVARVTRRRQREAYTASLHGAKGHDTMLRNLNVKYKAAMMKREKMRAVAMRNSVTGFGMSLLDAASSLRSIMTMPQNKCGHSSIHSLVSLATIDDKTQSLLEKEKEVLLALVNSTPTEAAERGLLIEDLYFLPMHTSMLSELEEFDLDAYGLAVDLALARLQREVCGDAPMEEVLGETMGGSKCSAAMRARPKKPGDEPSLSLGSVHASSFRRSSGWMAGGEAGEETEQEELHTFLHTAHEKLEAAFCTEELLRMGWGQMSSPASLSGRNSRRQKRQIGASLKCQEWRRSVFNQYTAEFAQASNTSWAMPHEQRLPNYARPGRWLGPGVITVAVSTREARRLKGCFRLELERMAMASSWHGVDEAIQNMVMQCMGLLANESLTGLSRSLMRLVSGQVRGGFVVENSSFAGGEKHEAQQAKFTTQLMEPLVLLSANQEVDEDAKTNVYSRQHSGDSHSTAGHTFTSNGMETTGKLEELSTEAKDRFALFLTEIHGTAPSTAAGTSLAATAANTPSMSVVTRNNFRCVLGKGPNSVASSHTDGDNGYSAAPGVLTQWPLHRKDHSHRAKLSRTGRVTAGHTGSSSPFSPLKLLPSVCQDGGSLPAAASKNNVSSGTQMPMRTDSRDPFVPFPSPPEGARQSKSSLTPLGDNRPSSNSISLPSLNFNEMRALPKGLQSDVPPFSKVRLQQSASPHHTRHR
ncbi:hypothetical protein TraAM80_07329 [Trypanosoma rangeli]|uniref:Uncharacterized protein n=1 Tax=Trypanosoma rangeli TaxID=5698 RepID=A0A3R7REB4_TRYRA|nr:uncharacterized protein TraAM80_07329 [Trypanosoma rangeli]RNF00910.1 hypothetical protein TraAM80_07329 [Trypanosoma rangeli]|eukprot:RNF00910.1 hypothetical protein TraAM80_07329 [Trypanosoma rangeli]